MSLETVSELSFPQVKILNKHLETILDMESGNSKKDSKNSKGSGRVRQGSEKVSEEDNYLVNVLKYLKSKTGKSSFTQQELSDPQGTVRKYANDKQCS